MARKFFILLLVIVFLFCFSVSVFADSLGYGSIADYYSGIGVVQNADKIETLPLPNNPYIDWSKSLIAWAENGLVLFGFNGDPSDYNGYFSYSKNANNQYQITNHTNKRVTYYHYSPTGWRNAGDLGATATYNFGATAFKSEDTPFLFVGKDVLVRFNDEGAFVFGNYVSSTLRITTSDADIENSGIDYPVIFDNAQLDIGLKNLNAYVAVSFQAKDDNSNWSDMSYVNLTNNSELYNEDTHSFYLTLKNLINRDLAIGDKIKIEYGWSTLDRLDNPHSYSFYNVYTRSTAYVGGSAYEPAPGGSSPGGGSSGNNDITNSLAEQTQAINDQTNAIHAQTDSINQQTNVISGMNEQLFNENTTNPNTIDIQDNTQNNTADLSSFFSSIQSAFTTRDTQDKFFTLTLPNGDDFQLKFPKTFIRSFITGNQALYTFVSAFWYIVFGVYIIFDMKKMYNKFKNGDFEGAMNSSSVDNVVKEALR